MSVIIDSTLGQKEVPALPPASSLPPAPDLGTDDTFPSDLTDFRPLAMHMDDMWRDPHYAMLYTDDAWRRRYTDQESFSELRDLPDFEEVTTGMLNRAFLSDVWGESLAEIDDTYETKRDVFALEVLGRKVTTEADLALAIREHYEPNVVVEAGARIGRGAAVGWHETHAGVNEMLSDLLSGQRNEYVEKTVAQARQDVITLQTQIAEGESYVQERLKSQSRGFVPPQGSSSARLPELRRRLALAEKAAKGITEENILGSLSRSADEVADESRESQEQAKDLFSNQIVAAHDGWWIMRVADSLGQSAPGTAASILNPALGLSLMYAQTFESSRAEYLSVAAERGLDTSEEAAERYGHNQALIQTPFEMVGTVAIGRTMKSIFKSIPRKALTSGPETYGKWLSSQIGKSVESTAGEVFITTPAQTVGEALLAESTGVRDQTTWSEKGTATLDAMSIALGQSTFMTGSSIVAAGTVKTAKGDFSLPSLSQAPRPGQKFDSEAGDNSPEDTDWVVLVDGEEVFRTLDRSEAESFIERFKKNRESYESAEGTQETSHPEDIDDASTSSEVVSPEINDPKDWHKVFQGAATVRRSGVSAEEIFGEKLDDLLITQLSGAPNHAIVEVHGSRDSSGGELVLIVNAKEIVRHVTTLSVNARGQRELYINYMRTADGLMKGYGAHSFARVRFSAENLGIQEITLLAMGEKASKDTWSGYIAWPRFGFDARLSDEQIAQLPSELSDALKISDLMMSQRGRAWWTDYGSATNMGFSLRPNARSIKIFNQYKERSGYEYKAGD